MAFVGFFKKQCLRELCQPMNVQRPPPSPKNSLCVLGLEDHDGHLFQSAFNQFQSDAVPKAALVDFLCIVLCAHRAAGMWSVRSGRHFCPAGRSKLPAHELHYELQIYHVE